MVASDTLQALSQNYTAEHILDLLGVFIDNFATVFYVDKETEAFVLVQMDSVTDHENVEQLTNEKQLKSMIHKYAQTVVVPEDRAAFERFGNLDYVERELEQQARLYHIYRRILNGRECYHRLLIVPTADGKGYIYGYEMIDADLRVQMENQEKEDRNQQVIEILASEYTSVYYIRMDDDGLVPYVMNEETESLFGNIFRSGIGYQEAFRMYAEENIAPEFRAEMIRAASLDNLKKALKSQKTIEYTYLNTDQHYCIMRFVKSEGEDQEPHMIGLGFADRDAEIRSNMQKESEAARNQEIISILASEYTSVYYINMDQNGLVPYSMNEQTETRFGHIFRSGIGYEEAFRMYAEENISISNRESMIVLGSLPSLRMVLKDRKSVEYTYLNTEQHFCTMRFVKSENEHDEPHTIGLGFADRDEEMRIKLQNEAEIKRNQEVIGILASEYTSVYYIRMDDDGLVPYAMNRETESKFGSIFRSGIGYTEAFRLYVEENVHPQDREKMTRFGSMENLKKALSDRKTVEYTYRNAENHYCTMRFVKYEGEHETPHTIGLGFADRDQEIREKINAEAKERLNQDVINILASEYSNVYYINLDDDGLVPCVLDRDTREQFGELYDSNVGYTRAFDEYIHARMNAADQERMLRFGSIENLKKELRNQKTIEFTFLDPDNRFCTMRYVKSERADEEPHMIGLGFADRDEQIRKDMVQHEQLERALANAEEASRAKSSFLFNMSHDIRTPMNAIIGFTNLLDKHLDDRELASRYLEKIKESNTFLLSLINNVLEMARIESGAAVLNEDYANIKALVRSVGSVFETQMARKHQTLTISTDVEHADVYADETVIREVLLNLLSNAVKYTTDGGTISLTVEETPSDKPGYAGYRLRVSDNGIGMSEDFIPLMFDDFARERTAATKNVIGTGLGMPIVKRLVDLQGGTIEVHSKLGEGSTFIVSVQYRISTLHTEMEVQKEASAIDYEALRGKRALLAEDIDVNALIATEILQEKGIIVEHAENGVICVDMLQKAEAGYYDFVLMDIQMPEMDGYQASRRIRSMEDREKASIPIIAMTANAFAEDRKNAYKAGMNAHVAKPFDLNQLFSTISNTLQYRSYYINVDALEKFKKYYEDRDLTCGYFIYRDNPSKSISFADHITVDMYGCSSIEEFMNYTGGTFEHMVHPEDLTEIDEEINAQQARSDEDIDLIEYRIIRKGGQVRRVRDIGFKIFDGTDEIFHVYIVDVTDLKE